LKIDAFLAGELAETTLSAGRMESLGFDGVVAPEVAHDPFLPLALAAEATERVRLQTGIAVAFARSPMTTAVTAADVHQLSGGRMALGLGSQVKAHVTRRFSMPWSRPAARMREYVLAVRAIWHAWETGEALDFRGDFYQHTLMTPMFSHAPSAHGWPPILVAGVGPAMTAVAGEVGDGYLAHGFTTPDYLRDVTLGHLADGAARSGRTITDIEVSIPLMTVIGDDDATIETGMSGLRHTIAFYGSLPDLEHPGMGALGAALHRLSKLGDWTAMAQAVPDELVHLIGIVGSMSEVAAGVHQRFGSLVDRVQIGLQPNDEDTVRLIDALRSHG
jgi:probable F420-dependent oxidoreductase